MDTLQGFNLGKKVREMSDSAQERVWIISPYIGTWTAVCRILGGAWWKRKIVDFRVVTDLSERSNVKLGTLAWLSDRGAVRSIPGVHAKVYIFDDRAIVTSANLTETAFTKRREIGLLLAAEESKDVIAVFESWWKIAREVTDEDVAEFAIHRNQSILPETDQDGFQLPKLWELQSKPSMDLFNPKEAAKTSSYTQYLRKYKELAAVYEAKQRMWADVPLFIEVDAFLNFLFHEGARPSEPYKGAGTAARKVDDEVRDREIEGLATEFANWSQDHPQDKADRMNRLAIVKKLLAKDNIQDLTISDVSTILDCIHAMGALPWPKSLFLEPGKNKIETIQKAWSHLLFGTESEEERIETCQKELHGFGPSSTQELLGCFYPEKFPLKNNNSDAGLRYLGFAI